MYRSQTFERIMGRMLDRVPSTIDKREGSIVWDALSPAAAELAMLYVELESVIKESFADTASREYLERRASERGYYPHPATYAVLRFEWTGTEPDVGARFNGQSAINYVYLGNGEARCETVGSAGNAYLGDLIPIEYIEGLETAKLVELIVPGRDVEDTESFRARYLMSFSEQAFGGNKQEYREKVSAMEGVGGVKVYPVWNGGGTVRVVITDADHNAPSDHLVDEVQTALDPTQNQGEGLGLAPIGHVVTVEGAREQPINVQTTITMGTSWQWSYVRTRVEWAIANYFEELASRWDESETLIVRVSQIESRILELEGVLDIRDTALNGTEMNIEIPADYIPVLGEVTNANPA